MRVLQVDTEMGWRGGQQQLMLLLQGLQHHDRFSGEAITVCRPGSALAERLRACGLPYRELAMGSPWSPVAAWRLRRLAQELGADLIHAQTAHANNLGALACLGSQVHLLTSRRVDFPPRGTWKYRRCVRIVAVSQAVAGVLAAAGIAAERIVVIRDGTDAQRFANADRSRGRQALGLADGEVAVLCIAALEDHKDHRTLLTAWGRIAAAHPRAHLLLAGEGSLRSALEAQAASLPRVRFLGFREDIPDLLAAADVCTLTSHLEGLGSTVMDAMVCGVPVVATRAGGIPELIRDGEDGLLCPVGDVERLAGALGQVIADPGLRQRLGTAARHSAQSFCAAGMVDAYVDLYDRVTRGA